jgi:hypothetical protein
MRLNVELVRKSPFNSGRIFRKLFHIALYVFYPSSTIIHGKKNQQRYSKVRKLNLTLQKSRMPQIRGVKGEAVVLYRKPLTTLEMRCHRLSRRVNNMASFQ